jgi:hypothetical protein
MLKAGATRTGQLLARINDSGQRTELMLRVDAERMQVAEARVETDAARLPLVASVPGFGCYSRSAICNHGVCDPVK